MAELLIELFSEEIPARMQARAAGDLQKLVTDGLVEAGITYEAAASFATPRRLTLVMDGVIEASKPVREERKGPRTDAPDQALEGFLRSTGLTKDQLEARDDKKGQVWFAVIEKPGRKAADVVAEVLEATIRNFPWPKSMRWGQGSLRWVRPLHSILCILSREDGAEVVPLEVDGIVASNTTEGHRFMGSGRFTVTGFEDYAAKLKANHVLLDAKERAEHIWTDATNLAFAQGLEVVDDKGLLSEVSGLVEWPVVLMGDIGEDFLALPAEVLQTSMREHQKFFSVRNPKTRRIEKYITVANRETADNGATILAGNSKVLAARLSDAKFFWENDLRTVERQGLEGMAAPLAEVTFHNKLGSQAERIERIAALAREIAPLVKAQPDRAAEAARIAKADLASEMVYEFPELQGIMGRYYAGHAGHDAAVAEACEMHYKPLGPSDEVPQEPVSVAVALADKIDTLTGFWAIDEKPTGSKDPFALRRAALGVIRLVLGNDIRLGLVSELSSGIWAHDEAARERRKAENDARVKELAEEIGTTAELLVDARARALDAARRLNIPLMSAFRRIADQMSIPKIAGSKTPVYIQELENLDGALTDLLAFFHDRLKVHLREEGIRHDVIDACLALPGANDDLVLLVKRAEALQAFLQTDDGENLVQGYKRANNILAAEEKKDGVAYEGSPEVKFAEADEEKALFAALDKAEPEIAAAVEVEDFAAAMSAMASLRAPIDAFFEGVVVNADNQIVRRNRLCLLNRIREVMHLAAIFSALEG